MKKKILSLLAAMGLLMTQISTSAVQAEGTQDMVKSDTGNRPYTERYTDNMTNTHLSVMHVYLKAGETAYFGTSVANAKLYNDDQGKLGSWLFSNNAMGTSYSDAQLVYANTADIYVTQGSYATIADAIGAGKTPGKKAVALIDLPSDADRTTPGYIYDRTQEADGVDLDGSGNGYQVTSENTISSDTAGYVADVKTNANAYTAGEDDIYTVVFFSADHGAEDPLMKNVDDTTPFALTQGTGAIASWDISVYNNGTLQSGRVFTSKLDLNTGDNDIDDTGVSTGSLYTKMYAVTNDGYQYLLDLNGLDAGDLYLSANKRGFLSLDSTGGSSSLLHSLRSDRNTFSDVSDHQISLNETAYDDDLDATYNLFFEEPSPDALQALKISDPQDVSADGITGFAFTGKDASAGTNYAGKGGTFSFTSSNTSAGTYQIELNFGTDNVVTLSNTLVQGTNSIDWDGKDAKGSYVSAGTYSDVTLKLKSGEVHFPLLDAEENPNGVKVIQENGTNQGSTTVYYNNSEENKGDVSYPWSSDNWTAGDEINAMDGADSASGAMAYTNVNTGSTSFASDGNNTAIDLWTYGSSIAVPLGSFSFTLAEGNTNYTVKRVWDNTAGTPSAGNPAAVTVTLKYSDGTIVTTGADGSPITNPVTFTADQYTWTNLDPSKSYTVTQTPITGYTATSSVTGNTCTITNHYTLAKLTLSCIWNGVSAGSYPASTVIHVYTDEKKEHEIAGSPFTLTAADNWTKDVTDLDPTLSYYAYEDAVTGFTTSTGGKAVSNAGAGFTSVFTNTLNSDATVNAQALIQWASGDSDLKYRPASVQVTLYQTVNDVTTEVSGTGITNPATLSAADSWYYAWSQLPKTDSTGTTINYSFKQTSELKGYTVATEPKDPPLVLGNLTSVIFDNTYQTAKFTAAASFTTSPSAALPSSVTMQLQQSVDGGAFTNYGDAVTLNQAGNWTNQWTDLPAYTSDNKPLTYQAVETVPQGYALTAGNVAGNAADGYTQSFDNTAAYTTFEVDDVSSESPASCTIVLYADGSPYDYRTLNAANAWSDVFENLPVKDESGSVITYTVEQEPIATYTTTGGETTGSIQKGYIAAFANTLKTVGFTASVAFNNGINPAQPDSAVLQLQQSTDGGNTYIDEGEPVTVNKADSWSHEWTGLAAYTFGNTPILYRTIETAPAGYQAAAAAVSGDPIHGYTQNTVNTYTYTKLTVTDTSAGKRPSSTTVTLYQNGSVYASCTLNDANDWTYTFTDLAVYDGNGNPMTYSVSQTAAEHYSTAGGALSGSAATGYTASFTNTYHDSSAVDTGDATNLALWSILLLLSCVIAAVCTIEKRQ